MTTTVVIEGAMFRTKINSIIVNFTSLLYALKLVNVNL